MSSNAAQSGPASTDPGPTQLPGRFVDADWLAEHLDAPDLRIIQVGGDNFYTRIHLPGAVMVRYQEIVGTYDGVGGVRAPLEQLTALFGRLGVTPQTRVVAYDATGGLDAARLIWTLASLGRDHGAVLDGGMALWYQQSRPMTDEIPAITPVDFQAQPDPRWEIGWEEVLQLSEAGGESTAIIDTRTASEFLGQNLRGPRGHVPGARHFDWMEALVDRNQPLLKDRQVLLAQFATLGAAAPEKPVVLYCQTAHRAAQTWLLMRDLGFHDVRLYDGSMAEWGLRNLPLKTGPEP